MSSSCSGTLDLSIGQVSHQYPEGISVVLLRSSTLSQASRGRKWRGVSGGVDCRGTSGSDFMFHGEERSQPLVSELWSLLWYSVNGGTD